MAATDALLAAALARDPAGPLITFYDDRTGERAELSAITMANWVAKTANLLQDDVGVDAGDRVAVLLPAHWQTAAVLFAAWSAGAVAAADPAGAQAAFTDAERVGAALAAGVPDVFALSLAPLGRGFGDVTPDGARDYATDVLDHGDRFTPRSPVGDDAAALDIGDGTIAGRELVEVCRRRAAELGLLERDRLLSTLDWDTPVDWVDGLLAPLAAGASLVLCPKPDPAALPGRAEAEQVTATLGVTLPGIRPL